MLVNIHQLTRGRRLMPSYTAISGDRVYGGMGVPIRDSSIGVFQWPPDSADTIPSVSGVNAPIHPKVLDLGASWNGYRYWMAFTPYPLSNDDTEENPSVVASSDGDTWVAPATNPIEAAPSGAATGELYNSDTHLLFKDSTLYLIWRKADHDGGGYSDNIDETLYYRSSSDGTTWSSAQTMLTSTSTTGSKLLSPSVCFFDAEYWMWVAVKGSPFTVDLYRASSLTGPWTRIGVTDIAITGAAEPWHPDVIRIPNGWAMLINDRFGATADLHLCYSEDGINWGGLTKITDGAPGAYRSSLVRSDSDFRCWATDFDARAIRQFTITGADI